MKIELSSSEYGTLKVVLIKEQYAVNCSIEQDLVRLNGSKNTEDVRSLNHLVKIQRNKLRYINNLLKKLK
jgi:ribosomal protein S26|tara:strand:- start:1024 stop:1233 length:210 start_codon:yes stop_codon:yes gene_type:complete